MVRTPAQKENVYMHERFKYTRKMQLKNLKDLKVASAFNVNQ